MTKSRNRGNVGTNTVIITNATELLYISYYNTRIKSKKQTNKKTPWNSVKEQAIRSGMVKGPRKRDGDTDAAL